MTNLHVKQLDWLSSSLRSFHCCVNWELLKCPCTPTLHLPSSPGGFHGTRRWLSLNRPLRVFTNTVPSRTNCYKSRVHSSRHFANFVYLNSVKLIRAPTRAAPKQSGFQYSLATTENIENTLLPICKLWCSHSKKILEYCWFACTSVRPPESSVFHSYQMVWDKLWQRVVETLGRFRRLRCCFHSSDPVCSQQKEAG